MARARSVARVGVQYWSSTTRTSLCCRPSRNIVPTKVPFPADSATP